MSIEFKPHNAVSLLFLSPPEWLAHMVVRLFNPQDWYADHGITADNLLFAIAASVADEIYDDEDSWREVWDDVLNELRTWLLTVGRPQPMDPDAIWVFLTEKLYPEWVAERKKQRA